MTAPNPEKRPVWLTCLDCCTRFSAKRPARGGMLPHRCPACRREHASKSRSQWKRDQAAGKEMRTTRASNRHDAAESVAAGMRYDAKPELTIVDAERIIEAWKQES